MRCQPEWDEKCMKKMSLSVILRKRSGLFRKAVLLYVLLSVIPTLLVTAAATVIFTKGRSAQNHQMTERYAAQGEMIISERLALYEAVFYRLLADKTFIGLSENVNSGEAGGVSALKREAADLIRTYIYTYNDIRGAAFIADNGDIVSSSKWYNSVNDMSWSIPDMENDLLSRIQETDRLTFLTMVNLMRYKSETPDYAVLMGMPVRNLVTKERCGVLVFALSQRLLLFEDMSFGDYDICELVTDEGQLLMAGAPDRYINLPLADFLESEYPGKRVSVDERRMEETGWILVSLLDEEASLRDTIKFISLVVALMVVITASFFFITLRLLGGYIGEIGKIADGIEHYDANVPGRLDIELSVDDELTVIVGRFNEMADRVTSLVEAMKERNEEIRVLETNRRRAEIKALEAQINPHFLYNTLDSINWRAIDHGEEEISDMLGMLGSLLRYSVSNIDMIVLLRAEIEWLKKYVFLQRDRFSNSFDCLYDIDEDALDFPIYKMLLQPLVENSILHAFAGMKSGGLIHVSAALLPDGRLTIAVEDNGCGMDEDTLSRMQREAEGRNGRDSRSIGISNVAMRLWIYYQGEADFRIESMMGAGTRTTLIIPRKECE